MGLYDSIYVYMKCPYCGKPQEFEAQTKDLDNFMNTYTAMLSYYNKKHKDYKNKMAKFFKGMDEEYPVFPKNVNDKEYKVWKNRLEKKEANARIPDEYKKLRYVDVIASCNSLECQFYADRDDIIRQGSTSGFGRSFEGKIEIKNGLLMSPIIDIKKKENLSEKELDKFKDKNRKLYKELKKKYKHDPIIARNWPWNA